MHVARTDAAPLSQERWRRQQQQEYPTLAQREIDLPVTAEARLYQRPFYVFKINITHEAPLEFDCI
jgi:hypothetical protein